LFETESLFGRQKLFPLATVVERQEMSGMEMLSNTMNLSETCAAFDREEGSKR
jgi:hypothetical protein